jgi:aspartate kinase
MNLDTVSPQGFNPQQIAETDFEKRRGISAVDVRSGFTQVHVTGLEQPVSKARIQVLNQVADAAISLDFLKLTPTGLSFIIPADKTSLIKRLLQDQAFEVDLVTERSIVSIHAVNMRDEEGLIAAILHRIIQANLPVDHVTDMHDRILLICHQQHASEFENVIRGEITNA